MKQRHYVGDVYICDVYIDTDVKVDVNFVIITTNLHLHRLLNSFRKSNVSDLIPIIQKSILQLASTNNTRSTMMIKKIMPSPHALNAPCLTGAIDGTHYLDVEVLSFLFK